MSRRPPIPPLFPYPPLSRSGNPPPRHARFRLEPRLELLCRGGIASSKRSFARIGAGLGRHAIHLEPDREVPIDGEGKRLCLEPHGALEIGRASCRERV